MLVLMYQGCIPQKTKNRRPIDEIAPKKQKMYLVPRYVYVDTYVPGLHPPPKKITLTLLKTTELKEMVVFSAVA